MSRIAAFCTLLLAALCATTCDKVPLLAPTQSTITLSINTTTLPNNGTAEVIATVVEQAGTAVQNGTSVTFTSSVGTVEPREARTDGGIARTTFRANSQSGTAKVGAFSGAARATELEILVGGAAASTVTVRTDPSTVPQTGGTVQVIAVVRDASGNGLPGAPVVFTVDNGTLGTNGGTTDQTGEARTSLTTNRVTVVRASVAGREGQATVNVVNLPTVSLSASPASPIAGIPVTFTVTPGTPAAGGNPVQNVVLDFGDGKPPANLGALTTATPISHVYDRADTYTATATVIDSAGQRSSNSIVISVQRAVVVPTITAPSTAQVGTAVTFTVAVANSSNIPIQSVILRYGDGTSTTLPPTGGTQQKTYITSGTFTATATVTDQTGTQYASTHQIVVSPAAAFDVTLDAVSADPAVNVTCTANYPKTCTANFVGAGVRVQLAAGCGAVFGGTPAACPNATGYRWDYGDGSPLETTTSRTVDHVFRSRGEFVITVTVFTSTGATGTQRLTLIATP